MRLSRYPVKYPGKKSSASHSRKSAASNHSAFARAHIRRLLLAALLLPLGLFLNFSAIAQTTDPSTPEPIVIDAKNPSSSLQRPLGDKFPEGGVPLEIKGDSKNWRFIIFENLSPLISIKVRSKRSETEDITITSGTWYPFKDSLPILLTINPQYPSKVVQVSYKLGIGQDKYQEFLKSLSTQDLKDWANKNNDYINASDSTLKLTWGQSSAPDSSPTVSPSPIDQDEISLTDIFKTRLFKAIVGLIIISIIVIFLVQMRLIDGLRNWYYDWKDRNSGGRDKTEQSPKPTVGGTTNNNKEAKQSTTSNSIHEGDKKLNPSLSGNAAEVKQQVLSEMDERLKKQVAELRLDKKLEELRVELANKAGKDFENELREKLAKKWDRYDPNIYASIQPNVVDTIIKQTSPLRGELNGLAETRAQVETRLRELEQEIIALRTSQERNVEEALGQINEVKDEQTVVRNNFSQVIAVYERVEKRLHDMAHAVEEKAGDLFYMRMLGLMLEKKVDVLSEDGFQSLIDRLQEGLHGFFKAGIERNTEDLQELKQKAESINAAFKNVVDKMSEVAAGGNSADAHQLVAHTNNVVADISVLQSQFQTRQMEVITTHLRIPVAAHPGARRTFLEELALGLKREIDKLSNPVAYFENELESLATSDVINLADLCDERHGRKEDSELERALQELFAQAGLRDIVPKRKEDFKTVEQELVEMVQGEPQDRLKVAEVLTRGFVYKRNEQETLLRKAGVKVYR